MTILRHQIWRIDYKNCRRFTSAMRLFIFTGILLLLFSCGEKKNTIPAGILSKEDMVKTLAEVYIAEEKVNRLALPRDSAEAVFEYLQEKVFNKTGVVDSVFKQSYNYYMDHPADMELIYTALVDSLQIKEQRAPVNAAQ